MASRFFGASNVLDRVFDNSFGLSDSENSNAGGEGVHGYLPMNSLSSMGEDERRDSVIKAMKRTTKKWTRQ